jgi:hypothetical protein
MIRMSRTWKKHKCGEEECIKVIGGKTIGKVTARKIKM